MLITLLAALKEIFLQILMLSSLSLCQGLLNCSLQGQAASHSARVKDAFKESLLAWAESAASHSRGWKWIALLLCAKTVHEQDLRPDPPSAFGSFSWQHQTCITYGLRENANGDVDLHFIVDTVLSSITNLLAFSSVIYPPGVTWIQMSESSRKKTFTTDLWPATTAQRSKKGKKTHEVPSKIQKQGLVSQAELRCSMSILALCVLLKIFVFKEWWHFMGRIEWFKQNKLHYKHKALSQCNNYQQSKQTSTQR